MKVTSKGQVTIPEAVRKSTGIGTGTDVYFKEENGRFYIVKNTDDKLSKWFGMFKDRDADKFLEDIRGR